MPKNKFLSLIINVFIISVLIIIWYIFSNSISTSKYILPTPTDIIETFFNMFNYNDLFIHILSSFRRIIIGFSISFFISFFISCMNSLSSFVKNILSPFINFLRYIPPLGLIPLLILCFGIGETSKIIVIILTAFIPIYLNTTDGINSCPKEQIDSAKILGISNLKILFHIQLPYAIPQIFTGMRTGLSYSFKSIIGAEMIASINGLGYMILESKNILRIDKVIVGIIIISILGIIIDKIFVFYTNLFFNKKYNRKIFD